MAIKAKLTADEYSKLSDADKANYKIQPDFSYLVELDGGFVTDKDPSGLMSALEKERDENRRIKTIADKLEAEKLAAERAKITDVEELKKHFQTQLDERDRRDKEERKKAEQDRLAAMQERAESMKTQKALEISSELFGTQAPLMLPHIEKMMKAVGGETPNIEIVDPLTGRPQLDQSIEGFKKSLSTNPLFAPMIVKSKASGGSANDGKSSGLPGVREDGKPKTYADYKPSELMALKRENPELFKSLQSQR